MVNEVNIIKKPEYLLAVVVANSSCLEEGIRHFQDILSACSEFERQKVLLDFHLTNDDMSLIDEVMYIKRIAQEYQRYLDAGNPPLKIAFWGSPDRIKPHSPSPKIGKEIGLNMFVTDNEAAAIAWLIG